MIITEDYEIREDGVLLKRTYSNEGYLLIQNDTGEYYSEAIDPENSGRTYTESDVKADLYEEGESEYVTAAKILLGEEE